jgi:hypothetical protein
MSRCHVALACLLIAAAAARAEEVPPRVAIVATAPALRNVIAAAEAKVSAAGGVRLVERHQIDRVLTEQGLAASGVTGGEQAVTAGKLLAADLLVAVDNDPANGEEAAAVVFDAATGVRYWDAATASRGEGLSDDIAAAVMTAVKKRYAGAATKMVALQTVRNADLPREFDGACRAAGAILMRCLASSPDVVVLERARLNKITDERQLTGIDNPLLASTISIELQIARSATGDGVDVTPALLKPGLERTVLRAITVPSRRPDAIAQVAAASITEALNAAAPRPSGDDGRAAESRRFVRETLLAWRHGDVATALESAEAAHALDPADRRAGAARAQALIVAGAAIIYEGNVADPDQPPLDWSMRTADLKRAPQSRLSDEDVDASLALTQRGTVALLALGCRPGGADDLRTAAVRMRGYLIDEEPLIRAAEITLRRYLGGIRWEIYERDRGKLDIRRLRLTKTQAAAYATIRRDFRHLRMSVEQPVARSMVRSPQTFDTYGRFPY